MRRGPRRTTPSRLSYISVVLGFISNPSGLSKGFLDTPQSNTSHIRHHITNPQAETKKKKTETGVRRQEGQGTGDREPDAFNQRPEKREASLAYGTRTSTEQHIYGLKFYFFTVLEGTGGRRGEGEEKGKGGKCTTKSALL